MHRSSIRLPAEWEQQSAVQFTFPQPDGDWSENWLAVRDCFVHIISIAASAEPVILLCRHPEEVRPLFCSGIQDHLLLLEIPSNDSWARDHAPITVLRDGQPLLMDFVFNGWGLKFPADLDNQISRQMKDSGVFGDHPMQTLNLVLEGGSIESDGEGTLLTTSQCLLSPNRNPGFSKQELEHELKTYLGVDRILWLHHGHLEGDDTDAHIDTLARFCDPSTIAYVRCTDRSDIHFEGLQHMEAELKQFRTRQGKSYRLIPLPLPTAIHAPDGRRLPATYANFLILNDLVMVPTYGVAEDEQALAILAGCFPDRKVSGVDCRALIAQNGSLHCISMQYPANTINPLLFQKK